MLVLASPLPGVPVPEVQLRVKGTRKGASQRTSIPSRVALHVTVAGGFKERSNSPSRRPFARNSSTVDGGGADSAEAPKRAGR